MLYVHVGYHKTGSTALQQWLQKDNQALIDAGLIVPPGLSSWLGHPELAWIHLDDDLSWQDRHYDATNVLRWYAPYLEMSRQNDVLLTTEEFCRLDELPAALSRLAATLAPFAPRVFGFVRDPLLFSLSRYRHEVQSGSERRTLREFLLNADTLHSADFPRRTDLWRAAFPGTCTFASYEEAMHSDGSILPTCIRILGLELATLPAISDDPEFKLHTSLLPAARSLAAIEAKDERNGLFKELFALSKHFPSDCLESLLDGECEDIRMLYSTIDMRRL